MVYNKLPDFLQQAMEFVVCSEKKLEQEFFGSAVGLDIPFQGSPFEGVTQPASFHHSSGL
jgi:hypothetical protein